MHVLSQSVVTAVIGSPGSGKSTLAAFIKAKAAKKGIPVWCNYHVAGCRKLDMTKLVETDTSNSIVIIDEAGGIYNSRNYKAFSQATFNYFATARHRKTQVFILVQAWDRFDLALRELCNTVFLVRKSLIFPHTSVVQRFSASLELVKDEAGNCKEFSSVFKKKLTFWMFRLPLYKAFDSFVDYHTFTPAPLEFYPAPAGKQRKFKAQ